MRSRDGTQTVCVVCDNKSPVESGIGTEKSPSKPVDQDSDSYKPIATGSQGSSVIDNILLTLHSCLHPKESHQPLDTFVNLLEAALPVLSLLSLSDKTTFKREVLVEIQSKIGERLIAPFQSKDPNAVINYFKFTERLLKASITLNKLVV